MGETRKMNRIYFKTKSGNYHYGAFFEDINEVTRIALALKGVAPLIMITNKDDHSTFETKNGAIVWPDDIDNSQVTEPLLKFEIPNNEIELEAMIKLQRTFDKKSEDWREIESIILAAASRDEINLYHFGWSID